MKTRTGVFVIVLNEVNELLVLHRVLNWRGWEVPKGGCDGKTEQQTLKEELWEELGLRKTDYKVVKKTNVFLTFKYPLSYQKKWGVDKSKFRGYVIKCKKTHISFKNNPEKEHDSYKWMSVKNALKVLSFPNQRRVVWKIAHQIDL